MDYEIAISPPLPVRRVHDAKYSRSMWRKNHMDWFDYRIGKSNNKHNLIINPAIQSREFFKYLICSFNGRLCETFNIFRKLIVPFDLSTRSMNVIV